MEIIKNRKESGDEYSQGNIPDPEDGKIYCCILWIEDDNLMVRGYWGHSIGHKHGGSQLDYVLFNGKISKLQ